VSLFGCGLVVSCRSHAKCAIGPWSEIELADSARASGSEVRAFRVCAMPATTGSFSCDCCDEHATLVENPSDNLSVRRTRPHHFLLFIWPAERVKARADFGAGYLTPTSPLAPPLLGKASAPESLFRDHPMKGVRAGRLVLAALYHAGFALDASPHHLRIWTAFPRNWPPYHRQNRQLCPLRFKKRSG